MAIQKKQTLGAGKKHAHEGFCGKITSYFSEQTKKIRTDKKKQFIFFVLGFLFFYLLFTGIVSIVPSTLFESGVANSVQTIISTQGIPTKSLGLVDCTETSWFGDLMNTKCAAFSANESTIIISWLCTGILEMLILIAAILSSFGVSWKKKLFGIIGAIVAGVIFNLIRIAVTINLVITQNTQTVELAHDVLFKVILFVYVAGFYIIWFYWAAREGRAED